MVAAPKMNLEAFEEEKSEILRLFGADEPLLAESMLQKLGKLNQRLYNFLYLFSVAKITNEEPPNPELLALLEEFQ